MNELNENSFTCEVCNNPVKENDDFCTFCGSLFLYDIFCDNHNDILADGVCIICSIPFCNECAMRVDNHFLCNKHSNYEIYEGMAKVYGSLDDTAVQYAKTCLEQSGLHPVLFRRYSPYGDYGVNYGLFELRGDAVTDIKVMVPFQEVLKSEEVLKSINIIN